MYGVFWEEKITLPVGSYRRGYGMLVKVLIDNISKDELLCEWGLSVYIEYRDKKILLDGGTSGAFARNAKRMGIDLNAVDFGVLSHAHYDHADGLSAF